MDFQVVNLLFSGLARIDNELNVIPDVAHSWQVLDGGRRYIFHLRDDVRWTDGSPVTSRDFEWAWKRNLQPSFNQEAARFLFDIAGAQAYYRGEKPDPGSIGVRAVDDWTLEVTLVKPFAYFPYVVTLPNSLPLPRVAIERYGEGWWQPEHIVSNGAFRLVETNPGESFTLERNPHYHGEFPGNVGRIERKLFQHPSQVVQAYQENQADIAILFGASPIPEDMPPEETRIFRILRVVYLFIHPDLPPFDDERVRRALGLSVDKARMMREFGWSPAYGGIIPPGMPGHSPDLSPRYDPGQARRLLAEAGYPNGQGLPVIKAGFPEDWSHTIFEDLNDVFKQWREELGIRIEYDFGEEVNDSAEYHLIFRTWVGDYPDPDSFLRKNNIIEMIKTYACEESEFQRLVEAAAHLPNRQQRMDLYRQADRWAVAERAIVLILFYAKVGPSHLVKPWVKNYRGNLLGHASIKDVFIEEH